MKNITGWMFAFTLCVGCAHAQVQSPNSDRANVLLALRIGDTLNIITDDMKISKSDMLSAHGIEVILPDSDLSLNLKITQFTISRASNDSIVQAVSYDNGLTVAQKSILGSAPSDAKIYIENIRAVDASGSVHIMPSKAIWFR